MNIFINIFFLLFIISFSACTSANNDDNNTAASLPIDELPVLQTLTTTISESLVNNDFVGKVQSAKDDAKDLDFILFKLLNKQTNIFETNPTRAQVADKTKYEIQVPTEFQISRDGTISVYNSVELNYILKSSYTYSVVALKKEQYTNVVDVVINLTKSGTLEISSAVYHNYQTVNVNDDTLAIYFDRSINSSSVQVDMGSNFLINGNGVIGSNSQLLTYDMVISNSLFIRLDSGGTASSEININNDSISINENRINDFNGFYPDIKNPKIKINKFNIYGVLETGSNICFKEGNTSLYLVCSDANATKMDGNEKFGITRSFNDNGTTIYDSVTGLTWQKNDNNITYTFSEANTYCNNLTLISKTWTIPKLKELMSITSKNESNPSSFKPYFQSMNNSTYWSSNNISNNTNVSWGVDFSFGEQKTPNKTNKNYIKCVSY